MPDLSIRKAFLDGIQEVFSIMFSDQIYFKYMDEALTFKNVYDESVDKVYKTPIALVGKVVVTPEKGENPVEATKIKAIFTIPTKEFIDKNIPITPQDYDTFKKGVIIYNGVEYEIDEIKPKTNITDMYMFYDIECFRKSKSSLKLV